MLGRAAEPTRDDAPAENHVSGRELCDGVVDLARREFGRMARIVFRLWGINQTDDFGEIVFNLIDANLMSKTDRDDRGRLPRRVRPRRGAARQFRDRPTGPMTEPEDADAVRQGTARRRTAGPVRLLVVAYDRATRRLAYGRFPVVSHSQLAGQQR